MLSRIVFVAALLLSGAALLAEAAGENSDAEAVKSPSMDAPAGRGMYAQIVQNSREMIVGVHGTGRGSGIIISEDGLIVTTTRAVDPARAGKEDVIEVLLGRGRLEEAKIMGGDAETGIVLIKISARRLPHLPIDGALRDPEPGETLLTLSNATNSIFTDYEVSASIGPVHAVLDFQPYPTRGALKRQGPVFELSALSINSGAAGGAVVDLQGRLRGLLIEEVREGVFLGQAIPVRVIALAIDRALAGAAYETSFIGGEFERPQPAGIVVKSAPAGSPLANSGLLMGDIILAVAGVEVNSRTDLDRIALGSPPGARIPLLIKRGGRFLDVDLITGVPPERGYLGLALEEDTESGLKVTRVLERSPFKLLRNDRVISINGFSVQKLADLEDLAGILYNGAEVQIRYRRGNNREQIIRGTLQGLPERQVIVPPPGGAAAAAGAEEKEGAKEKEGADEDENIEPSEGEDEEEEETPPEPRRPGRRRTR